MTIADPSEQTLWGIVLGVPLPPATLGGRGDQQRQFQVVHSEGSGYCCPDAMGQPTLSPAKARSVCMCLTGSKTNPRQGCCQGLDTRSCALCLAPSSFSNQEIISPPSSISTADVSHVVKCSAAKTGKDPENLAHIPFEMVEQHVCTDALTTQFYGRWVSDAFKTYTRFCKESFATLSADIVDGPRGDSKLH
ncbi:Hypothetical protein PHPALM_15831 [Phytophthora palmivora]|uniref:Uncharacterized protein n=1 Tax=Phytophthora palmivora TaxID=4796 RepID=A0A2P4XR61_9STRA|nr:Hypothetical protein PHPALM_15831 [Phytophthora palmivora]